MMNNCCCCFPLRSGILFYAYVSLVMYIVIFVFGGAIGAVMFVKHSSGKGRRTAAIFEPEDTEEESDLDIMENGTNSNDFDRQNKSEVHDMSTVKSVDNTDESFRSKKRQKREPIQKNCSRLKPDFRDDWEEKAYRKKLSKDTKRVVGCFGFCAMLVSLIMIVILFFLISGIHKERRIFIAIYIVLKCVILMVFFLGATAAGYLSGVPVLVTLPFLIFEVYMLFTVFAYFDD